MNLASGIQVKARAMAAHVMGLVLPSRRPTFKTILAVLLMVITFVNYVVTQSNETTVATTTADFNTILPDLGAATVLPSDWSATSFCTCDITSGSCDVNCCCDLECDSRDRAAFSKCTEKLYDVATSYCLRKDVVFTQNVEYVINTTSSNLFCVERDSYSDRNFYNLPQTVDNITSFSEYQNRYGSYNYSQSTQNNQAMTVPTLQPFYESGDPLLTLFANNVSGYLHLPKSYASDECEDYHPAGFWLDAMSSCTRSLVVSLEAACNSTPYLNMQSFFRQFRVAKGTGNKNLTESLRAFDSSSFVSVVPGNVTCVNVNGLPVTCSASSGSAFSAPHYNFSTSLCQDAVTQVAYAVTLAPTSTVIQDIRVNFRLQHLSVAKFPLVQTYSITWSQAEATNTFKRSGNPGYLQGEPVLAGKLVAVGNSLYRIALSGNRENYLTMVTSTAGGSCSADPLQRTAVRFGTNMRSGCTVSVSYENMTSTGICNTIYSAILNALLGDTLKLDGSIYVATFGNSQTNVTGDWVPILVPKQPLNPSVSAGNGVCQSMVLGMHLEILYANVGPLANPQAKIIGAQLSFLTGQDLRYTCTGAYCSGSGASGLQQTFEVVSSVAFTDVSRPSTAAIAEQPIITTKLPYDFFYPFYLPSTSVSCHQWHVKILVCSALFALTAVVN